MNIKQKVQATLQFIRQHLSLRIILAILFLLSFLAYLLIFAPRSVAFSYNGDNCVGQLSLLPKLLQPDANSQYQLKVTDTLDIAGYPIIGRKVCVVPLQAPKEGKVKIGLAPFGWIVARKSFVIEVPHAPVVSVAAVSESIPVAESLKVPISTKDTVFGYDLTAGDGRTRCASVDRTLVCDISQMQLIQGNSYALKVERHFKGYSETVGEKQVKVLDPVQVEQSSVNPDQVVYEKPSTFVLKTNKALEAADAVLERVEGSTATAQKTTLAVTDKQIVVTSSDELARDASYRLRLTNAKGADGSILAATYTLPFKLSGGPKVTGVNIGSFGVNVGQTIVVQLDQPIKADQDIAKLIHVNGNDSTSVTKTGDKINIRLNGMGLCAAFTVSVGKGLESEYGIASSNDWQFSSRIRCSTVATIGSSVQNRPIYAYSFGSGASTVLFTGAIHGNEISSKYLMDNWVSYLEEHGADIPQDKRIVIVPSVNPDGVAAATRNNAHAVNLNRNFATSNWAPDTQLAGGGLEKGAGGTSAMSEPEVAALAAFTGHIQPSFVISYHSQGSLVNSNDVGSAATLGPKYAQMTGYSFVASTSTEEAYGYAVTGTYEDWLAERSTPAILIELPTNTGRYFSRNVDAMWAMVRS